MSFFYAHECEIELTNVLNLIFVEASMKPLPRHTKKSNFQKISISLFKNFAPYIFSILLIISLTNLYAQSAKQIKRYEIDAKRVDVGYTSKDALPRGREFKRIDSTYYVGWMLEGGYKYEHASDFIGFKNAATQLSKAFELLEKDFKKEIGTRTSEAMTYLAIMRYHRDWDFTAYALMNCYSNMDQPEEVWAVLKKCQRMNLQDEEYLECYNYMAWTVHRNRFYTQEKYAFLKNSIDENEAYANQLLDSSLFKIKNDHVVNSKLFASNHEQEKNPGVWHYKSILYTYQLDIEQGQKYYDLLKESGYFPANNYATFSMVQAKFAEAEEFYNIAKMQDAGDKRLKESYYYYSILNAYGNKNLEGIDELKATIKANGSTPGFGWYNMALARNLTYNGQLSLAKKYLNRAEQFKEIHIGTTLGQSHYDFSNLLLKLIIKKKEIKQLAFQNKYWWFSFKDCAKYIQLTFEIYTTQFLIINQFALNPERDRVIYKLFSTESTVSFDEVYELIDGFSTQFFLEKFKNSIFQDSRFNVKRYYKLFAAKLLMKQKKYEEARTYLESILREIMIDVQHEKLLIARTHEALAICYLKLKDKKQANDNIESLYVIYPQLIPFSGLKIQMNLSSNASNDDEKRIVAGLKRCSIIFTENNSSTIPHLNLKFAKTKGKSIVEYSVLQNNEAIIKPTEVTYFKPEEIIPLLSLYIFGVGNTES